MAPDPNVEVEKATAEDIVLAIGETMRLGLEPLYSKILAPSLYQVYLHPNDHDRLRAVFADIEEDARKLLNEQVARFNRDATPLKNRLLKLVKGKLPSWLEAQPAAVRLVEPASRGWYVRFQEDPNGTLEPGAITVVADLAVGDDPTYATGRKTRRISTTRRLGKSETTRQVREERKPLAIFTFEDQLGKQSFEMIKEEIVIGRRAEAAWVDLNLETETDVSREHARVRRRGAAFEIKDVSSLGTTVNGREVPPSLPETDGPRKDLELWVPLPDGAKIELAGVITLHFRQVPSSGAAP